MLISCLLITAHLARYPPDGNRVNSFVHGTQGRKEGEKEEGGGREGMRERAREKRREEVREGGRKGKGGKEKEGREER